MARHPKRMGHQPALKERSGIDKPTFATFSMIGPPARWSSTFGRSGEPERRASPSSVYFDSDQIIPLQFASSSPWSAMNARETKMSPKTPEPEIGRATSAVLVSLLKTLLEKSVLSNAEVRVTLTKAAYDLHPHEYAAPADDAAGIILNEMLPRFPEDGGD
jgi:hypothetical protein